MNDTIFSLDIGTRKIGIFATRHYDDYAEVLVNKIVEHKSRAVRAGQIHDIDKVAALVSEIKAVVEKESGLEVKKVATAIAGRNLKSMRAVGEIKFDASREITESELRQVELSAIQDAINRSQDEIDDYLFVGYTVVSWQLDGEDMTNPLNHYANSLRTNIITTFLPKKVLESLFAVIKKAGLEISYLTLEPIAAAEAVLPAEMRHIPLVLVDIGAGTSDIAIVSRGSIQSFGMIPSAGDFMTEYICGEMLVDFIEAERIKREFGSDTGAESDDTRTIKYKDIFSREYEKSFKEIRELTAPAVKELSEKIASEIKTLVSSPDVALKNYAVVLVGGGSLTYGLVSRLAATLGIPENRVGLRSPAMVNRFILNLQLIKDLQLNEAGSYSLNNVFGPQTAVLLGVSCLSAKMPAAALIHVTINDKKSEIINFKEGGLTVISALVAEGINRQKITGRVGLAKIFSLNGVQRVIKGKLPEPARIIVNGEPAGINTLLKEGDRIEFFQASDGNDARVRVADILPPPETFLFNQKLLSFPVKVTINGQSAVLEEEIPDNAKIEIVNDYSLSSALVVAGVAPENLMEQTVSFDVLGQKIEKKVRNCILKVNGKEFVGPSDIINATISPCDGIICENIRTGDKSWRTCCGTGQGKGPQDKN